MYALHAYFLIGLHWPSGNNKRAEGVTSDNNGVQGIPSMFAPSPLLVKETLVGLLCVSHMYEMLKIFRSRPSLFQCRTWPKNIYVLRPTKISFLKTKLGFLSEYRLKFQKTVYRWIQRNLLRSRRGTHCRLLWILTKLVHKKTLNLHGNV